MATLLRLRLSDGHDFAVEMTASDPMSLRSAVAKAWAQVAGSSVRTPLQLHVHTLDPALGDEWYWVDFRDRTPRLVGGIVLSEGWLTPEEASNVWLAAFRTERLVSEHARSIRGLACHAAEVVRDDGEE